MKALLRDTRVQRLLVANVTGSIGSGVTIIAVPWLLIHRANGDQLYGWTTVGTTAVLFLLMPYYGAWLDRHSRKAMLLIGELFGFVATLTMAVWALATGHLETWQLIVTYFCGMLYYTLHYPAKGAFLQQVFAPAQYQSLLGLLEIQGQTATMIAGGLASMMIDRVPFAFILLADACTYLFSFAIQSTIPYQATHLRTTEARARPSTWHAMAEGWRWLHAHPRLTVFFACTMMPFIMVMVSNYLFPIYVAEVLHASAVVFGQGELVFAVGAVMAGMFMPRLVNACGASTAILGAITLCVASLTLIVAVPTQLAYFAAVLFFGFGNAGTRVARMALLFRAVPNSIIGRVSMSFGLYDRIVRTLLTSVMTLVVARGSPAVGFAILLVVLVAALVGAISTRRSVAAIPDHQTTV